MSFDGNPTSPFVCRCVEWAMPNWLDMPPASGLKLQLSLSGSSCLRLITAI